MSGAGFLAGTMSPAPITSNQLAASGPRLARSRAFDVFRRGGGGDGDAHAGPPGFANQPRDTGAQRQAALLDDAHVVGGLGQVQALDQFGKVGAGEHIRGVALTKKADALLAAGDRQQFAVEGFVPVPGQAVLGEGGVEGGAVAIALGLGERAIDVENQGVQCVHACKDSGCNVSGPVTIADAGLKPVLIK